MTLLCRACSVAENAKRHRKKRWPASKGTPTHPIRANCPWKCAAAPVSGGTNGAHIPSRYVHTIRMTEQKGARSERQRRRQTRPRVHGTM